MLQIESSMDSIIFTRESGVELKRLLQDVSSSDIYLLMDSNSRVYCRERLQLDVPARNCIVLRAGEQFKTLESVTKVWKVLSDNCARRNAVLVNLGGGAITDMGGFAASCFKRGIACVNVPTTLLSQIDASVGGKTGVNFNGLKNEIGTFSVPRHVIIDNSFLSTLSRRQVLSGFAEMLKHGLLSDEEYWAKLMQADLSDVDSVEFLTLIQKSVIVKNAIVQKDPCERGVRKALNFGHTVGHAIESVAIDHNLEIYHGDAVAYGMIAELYLSVKKMGFDLEFYKNIRSFIHELYPPCVCMDDREKLYQLMLHDKKNEHPGVNFTLLQSLGKFMVNQYCGRDEITEALEQI